MKGSGERTMSRSNLVSTKCLKQSMALPAWGRMLSGPKSNDSPDAGPYFAMFTPFVGPRETTPETPTFGHLPRKSPNNDPSDRIASSLDCLSDVGGYSLRGVPQRQLRVRLTLG